MIQLPSTLWRYEYIRLLADEATIKAKHLGLRPILADDAMKNWRLNRRFNIPFLGDYVADGWERMEGGVFVDITGLGESGGPTITKFEFSRQIEEAKSDLAYGVIERGQVQALIATYRRKS